MTERLAYGGLGCEVVEWLYSSAVLVVGGSGGYTLFTGSGRWARMGGAASQIVGVKSRGAGPNGARWVRRLPQDSTGV